MDVEEDGEQKPVNTSSQNLKPYTTILKTFQNTKPKVPDFSSRLMNAKIGTIQPQTKKNDAFEFSFKETMPVKKRRSRHSRINKAQMLTERGQLTSLVEQTLMA